MTRVVNVRTVSGDAYDSPSFVYIGRGSKWGNPYTHYYGGSRTADELSEVMVGSREEAIEKYEEWLRAQPELLAQIPNLKGKTLGCYCKPLACHGDILARMADET